MLPLLLVFGMRLTSLHSIKYSGYTYSARCTLAAFIRYYYYVCGGLPDEADGALSQ